MNIYRLINNISSLQAFQVLRFISFTIISVYFTQSPLSVDQIGDYEFLLFIASAVSFFWVTGFIQSLLPLYNSNNVFHHQKSRSTRRSPEIFNAFILLTGFSILMVVILFGMRHSIFINAEIKSLPYSNLLLLYILISNPACLVEYIYLLRNKGVKLLNYGLLTFTMQTSFVCVPVAMGYGLEGGLWGLVISSVFRILWLSVMMFRYAEFTFSFEYLKMHFRLGLPLILSTLLSGSAQYIDGIIVSLNFSPADFAYFRYGAKEMPLVVMLASGLNNAMLPEFYSATKMQSALTSIKERSRRLMHVLFPLTIILMLFTNDIYHALFTQRFARSADVFMIYLLLITSRMLFPQTILIGIKQTRIVLFASMIEIILNVSLSLILIPEYGIVGVALATVIVYIIEKLILMGFNYHKFGIKPNEYTPVKTYLIYTVIVITLFVLIDHRIIMLPRR